jgi:peroxiredoxin
VRRARAVAVVALALSGLLMVSGCSSSQNDGLSSQYRDGGTTNYVSGDGTVTQVPTANRRDAVVFDEVSSDGQPLRSADLRGRVVVLNFWYAACPPCRAEAKHLNTVSDRFKDQGVQLIGVNVRDTEATAEAFERRFKVSYPSVLDNDSGRMQLALSGEVAPNAVPTTIVLDVRGRVAARIVGAIDGPGTLSTLIEDELRRS